MVFMLVKTLINTTSKRLLNKEETSSPLKSISIGTLGGTLSSLTGLGGGVIMIPLMTNFLKMDIKKAGAISLGVIGFSTLFMSGFNLFTNAPEVTIPYSMGYILFPVVLPMTAGVIIGSPLGVKAKEYLSSKSISYIYALFLLIVIVKKITEIVKKLCAMDITEINSMYQKMLPILKHNQKVMIENTQHTDLIKELKEIYDN